MAKYGMLRWGRGSFKSARGRCILSLSLLYNQFLIYFLFVSYWSLSTVLATGCFEELFCSAL